MLIPMNLNYKLKPDAKEKTDPLAPKPGFFRHLYDIFLLFSGISTQQNLSRTRETPVKTKGMFLFRK